MQVEGEIEAEDFDYPQHIHLITTDYGAISLMRAIRPDSAAQSQNMASAFGGLATPPLIFNGQLVTKNVHLFCFRHSSDSASRSHSSPNGVPHSARALSWIPVHAVVSVLVFALDSTCQLTVRPFRWPGFECHVVGDQSREVLVPQPLDGICGPLKTNVVVVFLAAFNALFGCRLIVPFDPTSSDH